MVSQGSTALKSALGALAIVAGLGATAAAQDLVAYKIVDESSIPASLTGKPGDPANGREVVINRQQGNCLGCHEMPIPEQPFHGKVGPDLAGVASRYSEGEIRLRVVDPKVLNSATIMPAFYRVEGFHRVVDKFAGKPILSAEQVEDVVAYLMTLK